MTLNYPLKKAEADQLRKEVDQYLSSGGKIKTMPIVTNRDLITLSKGRYRQNQTIMFRRKNYDNEEADYEDDYEDDCSD